jgi:hypothetical protein
VVVGLKMRIQLGIWLVARSPNVTWNDDGRIPAGVESKRTLVMLILVIASLQ